MVGPSGVGKTETAMTLADLLYGGEQNMIIINMSEFKEEHKVSTLMGSPPGYVGYGEGGVLTEAVRRRPYSVVLLDEMEKAHPGVQDLFYQVFDKGMLRDGEGRDIDFKNTVILHDLERRHRHDHEAVRRSRDACPTPPALAEALRPDLLKIFKPAFLGRVTVVPYFPLGDDVMRQIIELQLGRIGRRVAENYKAEFTYEPALIEGDRRALQGGRKRGPQRRPHSDPHACCRRCPREFLARMADGLPIKSAHVAMDQSGNFQYRIG